MTSTILLQPWTRTYQNEVLLSSAKSRKSGAVSGEVRTESLPVACSTFFLCGLSPRLVLTSTPHITLPRAAVTTKIVKVLTGRVIEYHARECGIVRIYYVKFTSNAMFESPDCCSVTGVVEVKRLNNHDHVTVKPCGIFRPFQPNGVLSDSPISSQ